MENLIFVYGTLLSGLHNWERLLNNDNSVLLGSEKLKGGFTMISLGGFPGVILTDDGHDTITGEVYKVSDDILTSIDRLEGYRGKDSGYNFYDRISVNTKYGRAHMYVLPEEYLGGYDPVPSGNWKEFTKQLNYETI